MDSNPLLESGTLIIACSFPKLVWFLAPKLHPQAELLSERHCTDRCFCFFLQIMAGFLIGYLVAALARHNGQKYTNNAAISAAPAGQFLWVRQKGSGCMRP